MLIMSVACATIGNGAQTYAHKTNARKTNAHKSNAHNTNGKRDTSICICNMPIYPTCTCSIIYLSRPALVDPITD